MNYIQDISNVNTFDIRNFGEVLTATENSILSLFDDSNQRQQIYISLHVDGSYKLPPYTHASKNVAAAYAPEKLIDYTSYYDQMITDGYQIIVYGGEWDARNNPGNMDFLKNIKGIKSSFW